MTSGMERLAGGSFSAGNLSHQAPGEAAGAVAAAAISPIEKTHPGEARLDDFMHSKRDGGKGNDMAESIG